MNVILTRKETSNEGTFGELDFPGGNRLYTAELPWKNNQTSISCIPCGVYRVTRHKSPSKGDCYLIHGVLGRTHVLFHSGNYAGDVSLGFISHSEACILPGLAVTRMGGQKAVSKSKAALNLMKLLAPEEFLLSIVSGCEEPFIENPGGEQ